MSWFQYIYLVLFKYRYLNYQITTLLEIKMTVNEMYNFN